MNLISKDRRVLALTWISFSFEGVGFLFLYFWPRALAKAHNQRCLERECELPHGVIFASFMSVMVLGATFFNAILNDTSVYKGYNASFTSCSIIPTALLAGSVLVGGLSLLASSFAKNDLVIFSLYLMFEFCNGIYVPSMAFQRRMIVSEVDRAGIYSLMKLPLFALIVISICTVAEEGNFNWVSFFQKISSFSWPLKA
jgi:MFS transporter, MFS domain-containing protein family, molybdate-anion transporter